MQIIVRLRWMLRILVAISSWKTIQSEAESIWWAPQTKQNQHSFQIWMKWDDFSKITLIYHFLAGAVTIQNTANQNWNWNEVGCVCEARRLYNLLPSPQPAFDDISHILLFSHSLTQTVIGIWLIYKFALSHFLERWVQFLENKAKFTEMMATPAEGWKRVRFPSQFNILHERLENSMKFVYILHKKLQVNWI